MKKTAKEVTALTRTYDLILWIIPILQKFPKGQKYLLGDRIESLLLDILELLIQAVYTKNKIGFLKEANLKIETLRYMVRLVKDLRYLSIKNYGFYIHDPKKRLISAAPYSDRVIHHALINVIGPIITKTFIYDLYACMKGRGTHKAVRRYREFRKKNTYVLKCDIKKYFWNIDHEILYSKVENKIKCRDTLWLARKIIDSRQQEGYIEYFLGDDLFTPVSRVKGIPIGNLTSQFFANLYLNDFDHFIKEELRVKCYIRYCDDFVIFDNSKSKLNRMKNEAIRQYLATLRLKLHPKKSRTFKTSDGVDFLGYRIYPDHMKVRKSVVKRYRRKLRKMAEDYGKGEIGLEDVNASIQSWIGHVKHADSYMLRKELFSSAVFCRFAGGVGP